MVSTYYSAFLRENEKTNQNQNKSNRVITLKIHLITHLLRLNVKKKKKKNYSTKTEQLINLNLTSRWRRQANKKKKMSLSKCTQRHVDLTTLWTPSDLTFEQTCMVILFISSISYVFCNF